MEKTLRNAIELLHDFTDVDVVTIPRDHFEVLSTKETSVSGLLRGLHVDFLKEFGDNEVECMYAYTDQKTGGNIIVINIFEKEVSK